MNGRLTQPVAVHFHSERRKRENEILLVRDLFGAVLLVPLADKIILAAVIKDVCSENGFHIAYGDARLENVVCGFDITVTVVDPDDELVFELLHGFTSFCPSLRTV